MYNIRHKSETESEPEFRLGAILKKKEGGKTIQRVYNLIGLQNDLIYYTGSL